jgi:hypothetical protein
MLSAYRCLGLSAYRRIGVSANGRMGEWAGVGRLRANVFVPEGLNDRSLVRQWPDQGPVHNRIRPVGCGMIWVGRSPCNPSD